MRSDRPYERTCRHVTDRSLAGPDGCRLLAADNWRLAILVGACRLRRVAVAALPAVVLLGRRRLAALVAAAFVVNAWGRYNGGLLVAPAMPCCSS